MYTIGTQIKNHLLRIFFVCLFVLFLFTEAAYSRTRVYGELEWDYSHYNATESGVERWDADSLSQSYYLVVARSGVFYNGRGGRYNFSLGGNWVSLDTDYDKDGISSNIDLDDSKLLFNGDIVISPGGLPFRLTLYSKDMTQADFEKDTIFPSGSFYDDRLTSSRSGILVPQINDDMDDGTRITSGATMVLGIRNGSYLGKYREMFSGWPKLFFDYRETFVKDLKSLYPEHYTERELAFVSLNKKHNWFHYRVFERDDKIVPSQSYSDKLYMIGTVDQYYKREWINLTNWIQLSTDASYLTEVNPERVAGVEKTYNFNFFTKTSRPSIKSSSFAYYSREERYDRLVRKASIPVYASGSVGRDVSWNAQFVGSTRQSIVPFALVNSKTFDEYAFSNVRFDLNKTGNITYSPSLQLEVDNYNDGDGFVGSMGLEATSKRKQNLDRTIYNRFLLSYFVGEQQTTAIETDLWEINNDLLIEKPLSPRMLVGAELDLTYGSGVADYDFTNRIPILSRGVMNATNQYSSTSFSDEVVKARLESYLDHVSLKGLKNRLGLRFEYIDTDGNIDQQFGIIHRLDSRARKVSFHMSNEVVSGDRLNSGFTSEFFETIFPLSEYDGLNYYHSSFLEYSPGRQWFHRVGVELDWIDPDDDVNNGGFHAHVVQKSTFTHNSKVGLRRELLNVSEVIEYEMFDADQGESGAGLMALLDARLYPNTWSSLGARFRYQGDLENNGDEMGFGVYAGIDFSLLDVEVEYENGMRNADDIGVLFDRDEERWQIKIRKTF